MTYALLSIYLSFCQNEKGTSFFSFSDDVITFVIVFLLGWETNRTSGQVEECDGRNRTLCVFKWMWMARKMSFPAIHAVVKVRRVALLISKKSCVCSYLFTEKLHVFNIQQPVTQCDLTSCWTTMSSNCLEGRSEVHKAMHDCMMIWKHSQWVWGTASSIFLCAAMIPKGSPCTEQVVH